MSNSLITWSLLLIGISLVVAFRFPSMFGRSKSMNKETEEHLQKEIECSISDEEKRSLANVRLYDSIHKLAIIFIKIAFIGLVLGLLLKQLNF